MVEVGRRWREHKAQPATGARSAASIELSGFGLEDGDEAFARQLQRQMNMEVETRPVGLIVD